jgi:hypothetical protein
MSSFPARPLGHLGAKLLLTAHLAFDHSASLGDVLGADAEGEKEGEPGQASDESGFPRRS